MSRKRITYRELTRRLDRLASSLLFPDKPFGDYSESDTDKIHGYVVLAHAEIEDYLECLAIFVADQSRRKSTPTNCHSVISRLIFFRAAQGKDEIEESTTDSIAGAFSFFEKFIEKNNGIKRLNVFRMFMPLGVTHSDCDPILMTNLDQFGILRGAIAHTAARLKQGSSPSAEKSRVANILTNLSHFDETVRRLM
jgi:hypothetical protein